MNIKPFGVDPRVNSRVIEEITDYGQLTAIAKELGIQFNGVKKDVLKTKLINHTKLKEAQAINRSPEALGQTITTEEPTPESSTGAAEFEEDAQSGKEKMEAAQAESDKQVEADVNGGKKATSEEAHPEVNKRQEREASLQAQVDEMKSILDAAGDSKAAKIRVALEAGLERSAIAKALDVRYQQVFQVEKQMKEKAEKQAQNKAGHDAAKEQASE